MRSHLLDPCTFIRVQSWNSQAAATTEKVEIALGTRWPKETGTIASGRADILCIGPTDWLVTATDPDAKALHRQLEDAFDGSAFRATNVSQALARIEVQGPEVRALLLKGCALDLHPSRFLPGRCARTRFAALPAILRCEGPTNFECVVASSYRDYLLSWLADAAEEFLDSHATRSP
jgi:sarcosine oxidase subunit gamma